MICDRCHARIHVSSNPDQPICACCARHLRAGGGWPLGSPTPAAALPRRPVDLELLPLRAHVIYGEVPLYPIRDDFELAACVVAHEADDPAAHWHIEAIRWRRVDGYGKPLEHGLPVIAGRVAARLWKLAERRMVGPPCSG